MTTENPNEPDEEETQEKMLERTNNIVKMVSNFIQNIDTEYRSAATFSIILSALTSSGCTMFESLGMLEAAKEHYLTLYSEFGGNDEEETDEEIEDDE